MSVRIINGDCREVLQRFEPGGIDNRAGCCDIADRRLAKDAPLFVDPSHEDAKAA